MLDPLVLPAQITGYCTGGTYCMFSLKPLVNIPKSPFLVRVLCMYTYIYIHTHNVHIYIYIYIYTYTYIIYTYIYTLYYIILYYHISQKWKTELQCFGESILNGSRLGQETRETAQCEGASTAAHQVGLVLGPRRSFRSFRQIFFTVVIYIYIYTYVM